MTDLVILALSVLEIEALGLRVWDLDTDALAVSLDV